MSTPTHEAMIKLSGVLSALREAKNLIELDPEIPADMLASVTGLMALFGQEWRDFTDVLGSKVRVLSPGAYTSSNASTVSDIVGQVNRNVEYARRCFQSSHEHFVSASNALQDLRPVDVPTA